MDHSYEEIRNAALDILAGRETCTYEPNQYGHLEVGVAEVLARRDGGEGSRPGRHEHLSPTDAECCREVFWDMFRQGIITLGSNRGNPEYPFFSVSQFGSKTIEDHRTYFFHDVSSYTAQIKESVPAIDPVTLVYLQEAFQSFRSGCLLSCSVMLGVATEHTFLLMLEAIDSNPGLCSKYKSVKKERSILRKVNKFRNILDKEVKSYPTHIKEDLDTHFAGILSIIRSFRNQSGHPTGKIIGREQAYVLLNLFVPYCRKIYDLKVYFAT